ncbi:hypothetical protein [Phaeocystidibacter marisrubri]|uniref:Transcription regulator BetR N-terminal domain-containing protein n=1 Tax=Phaeocystidibacter marisrubri TaxID=1577780 RepID=A0A6L3ZCV0_9FLAO|nr:hypothetical protein [Phaeocystidibacter marisrubri]KAB2815691.1 hypothetical protein F8C82_08290 [Phaeocystidibacter marisrubri]GGH65206.1 hypothetical protein GCM10011318_01980 [Phaeocystidibacter marisrubri]
MKNKIALDHFQKSFIQLYKAKLGTHTNLAEKLSSDLNTSLACAYRKINGKTKLTLSDVMHLSSKYLISTDYAMQSNSNNVVLFNRSEKIRKEQDMIIYFEKILNDLQELTLFPNATLYYSARDLPLFHYFKYPNLSIFKLQVWIRSQAVSAAHLHHVFQPEEISNRLSQLSSEIANTYNKLSTIELWTTRTLSNVLEQIKYCYYSGHILRPTALSIIDDVLKMIDDCEYRTKQNQKRARYRTEVYLCDYIMMANGALANINSNRKAWIAYSGIELISTNDEAFCRDFETAFLSHMNMGVQISGSAARQRSSFFSQLRMHVNEVLQIVK